MTKHVLKAEKRTSFGGQLNQLRKKGILPANIFGKGVDSLAIQTSLKEFDRVFREAGETGVVYISIDGEKAERPTLISSIDLDAVTGRKLHADLKQVNLKEKVNAFVPVEIEGEPDSVKSGSAAVNVFINEIEIEALPTDIPEKFVVSVAGLKEIGDHLTVSDLSIPSGVEVKAEADQVIVSLVELEKEEVVTESAPTQASAETEPKTESEKE